MQVNGAKINLPYTASDKSVKIFLAGRYVRVETECKIDIEWDGSKNAELITPDSFATRMNGICGNCDKEQNELTGKDGTLSQSEFAKQYSKPVGDTGLVSCVFIYIIVEYLKPGIQCPFHRIFIAYFHCAPVGPN